MALPSFDISSSSKNGSPSNGSMLMSNDSLLSALADLDSVHTAPSDMSLLSSCRIAAPATTSMMNVSSEQLLNALPFDGESSNSSIIIPPPKKYVVESPNNQSLAEMPEDALPTPFPTNRKPFKQQSQEPEESVETIDSLTPNEDDDDMLSNVMKNMNDTLSVSNLQPTPIAEDLHQQTMRLLSQQQQQHQQQQLMMVPQHHQQQQLHPQHHHHHHHKALFQQRQQHHPQQQQQQQPQQQYQQQVSHVPRLPLHFDVLEQQLPPPPPPPSSTSSPAATTASSHTHTSDYEWTNNKKKNESYIIIPDEFQACTDRLMALMEKSHNSRTLLQHNTPTDTGGTGTDRNVAAADGTTTNNNGINSSGGDLVFTPE